MGMCFLGLAWLSTLVIFNIDIIIFMFETGKLILIIAALLIILALLLEIL